MTIEEKIKYLAATTRWNVQQLQQLRTIHNDEFINNMFIVKTSETEQEMEELAYELS
ncbi:hypothetical protein LOSG293_110700 [Secundilactobacillus oryzae JCM 18671]|uniref:Uncharacterized protein n=1 Tax=Secundilactobacillus oryzae JCM 18671 TaxID=1291743 RepID=A0A081BI86_9LACO|nr:hypothetical protein [Secundilactobacillus oryzae]GAK47754.1 hypothetical protein LOSG293_110700 [Secundilactobacillus oryzae JCM 18671]